MNRTILVTGGAGFIGSCFIRQLFQDSTEVRVVNLDKLTYAATTLSTPNAPADRYQLVEGDIGDAQLVEALLEEHQPDWIVNFAAESHVDRSIDGPAAFVATNVVGTCNLLDRVYQWWRQRAEETQRDFRFLHVSTDEVYGSLGPTGLFREDTPYRPNSPYSASKAASDHFVRAYHHTFGLPVLTTNCSNNYGPYQFPEKLIPLVTLNAIAGKALPVYGDGSNVRDWLFVEDHCRAIQTVLQQGRVGEVYNVGGDNEQSNLQVVQTICDVVDELSGALPGGPRRNLITFVKDRPGHDRRYAIDFGKLHTELGWQPQLDFENGLRQTIAWYLENQAWVDAASSANYAGERLGHVADASRLSKS
ncbi:dTDP-glucose 4,6-dehydratase [Aureliella helgolandensis]|uniref:dTDP-glucose 4,6-dehydratase n=1 Tax=Aureliella helgolandensis TaxID=2527968 RepID=A0A518GFC7_9BACT|nr:dTDP-glucose 4,6-dehydratase [Aureliella helgolandensis]QDV27299.1 dTDP-glucose 4,6-dehydratase 2 [Aureliella helgolandensis]